jgi:hypothetical protein
LADVVVLPLVEKVCGIAFSALLPWFIATPFICLGQNKNY